jgi:hypothetical protein
MSRAVHISLDELRGRLVDPPIVDHAHYERSLGAFVVTLVASEAYGEPAPVVVRVAEASPEGRIIRDRVDHLRATLSLGADVARIVHQGAGNFTLWGTDGRAHELADDRFPAAATVDASFDLQSIARAAETAYAVERRGLSKAS